MSFQKAIEGRCPGPDLGRLAELAAPQHEAVAGLVHGCSGDPAARTVAAATLVLTLWQAARRNMSLQPPSVLLVHAGGAGSDPVDALADLLASGPGRGQPAEEGTGRFVGGTAEMAPRVMANAARTCRKLGPPTKLNEWQFQQQVGLYHDARLMGYGAGTTHPYSRAWHEELGWVAGEDDTILLRLDTGEDRAAFRQDVLSRPGRLVRPEGPGALLHPARKSLCVSGSLPAGEFDEALVEGLLAAGPPPFFLPHATGKRLDLPLPLRLLGRALAAVPTAPVDAAGRLPPGDWWAGYHRALRRRLSRLPEHADYSVRTRLRELPGVCQRIALRACPAGTDPREAAALSVDLHALALRGIAVGIAGLAWHCLGLRPGCPRAKALQLLRELRRRGPMTRRDLQRRFKFPTAEGRDAVLKRLAAEGLVRQEGRGVAAVGCREFVEALHARAEFPMPEPAWPRATGAESR